MDDVGRQPGAGHAPDALGDVPALPSETADSGGADAAAEAAAGTGPGFDESIVQELSTLFDDGQTYVQAEIAFQKTRAKLASRTVGIALLYTVVGLILLHIAFLALAVGLVIALAPLVTIWGAIAIVVGGLLIMVALLGRMALKRADTLSALFSDGEEGSR